MRPVLVFILFTSGITSHGQADYIPLKTTIPIITAYSARHVNPLQFDVSQASLAYFKHTAAAIYNERRFLLKDLSITKLAMVYPHKSGGYGCSVSYAGNRFYNETRLAMGFGRKLNNMVAIGIQFSYLLNRVYAQVATGAFSSEAGILLKLSENIQLGFQLRNLIRSSFKNYQDRLPVTYGFGMGYDISEKFFLTALVEKQASIQSDLTVAMRYLFLPAFYVQAGITSQLHQLFLSMGLAWNNKRLEFNAGYHDQLGFTPGLLFIFPFGEQEE